jgi:hypothetical protein
MEYRSHWVRRTICRAHRLIMQLWSGSRFRRRLSHKSAATAVCCRILQRPADVRRSPTLIRRTAESVGTASASSLGISPTPSTYATASPACATQPCRCVSAPSCDRSRPLTPRVLLLRGDWSALRAAGDRRVRRWRSRRGPAARKSSASPPPVAASQRERAVYGDHRRAAGVDGVDALGVVDALKVNGGDAEVGVPELALDDD